MLAWTQQNTMQRAMWTVLEWPQRGGLLELRANTGRFESIPFNERICQVCNSDIETEFHFLLICPYFDHLRQEFIPSNYYMHPSEVKFKILMNKDDTDLKKKICQYLILALKLRDELLHERS